jgi:hypothetical protein
VLLPRPRPPIRCSLDDRFFSCTPAEAPTLLAHSEADRRCGLPRRDREEKQMNDDVKAMQAALAQRFCEELAAIPAGQVALWLASELSGDLAPFGGPRLVPAVC